MAKKNNVLDKIAGIITEICSALDFYGFADGIIDTDLQMTVEEMGYRQIRQELQYNADTIPTFLDYVSDEDFADCLTPEMMEKIAFVRRYQEGAAA